MTRSGAVVAVLAGLLVGPLAGCSSDATEPSASVSVPAVSTSGPAPSAPLASTLPQELLGTWMTRLTRDEMRADLARAGFGEYADAFFVGEKIGEESVSAVTFVSGAFEIAYLNPDGTWQVGWRGSAHEADGVLTIHDDYFGIDDSYRWSVRDGELTLDFRSTTGTQIRNVPSEAYSRAYFSRPYRSVDCTPEDLDACL